jgi:hypothetical protein
MTAPAQTCANIIQKAMKTKKRINKTTTSKTTSQNPTQNENDDAFTQHAGKDKTCITR